MAPMTGVRRAALARTWIGVLAAAGALAAAWPVAAQAPRGGERLFYMVDTKDSFESFAAHIDAITIVGPQSFRVDSLGNLTGAVDPRVLELAQKHGVAVMPLIVNPGWNRELFHRVLEQPEARARVVRRMVELARQHDFRGWQFDFEHIHISDRDALTAFYREAADALHADGRLMSIAVMPEAGTAEASPFHRWFHDYLSGAYDLKAIADIGDFISVMTYVQHTSRTPPGPVGGVPWTERVVRLMLEQGVPPEKISLGVAFFSYHFFTGFNEERKGFPNARGLSYAAADALLRRAGAQRNWDDTQKAHWAMWENAGTFEHLWLEDARSVDAKLDLVDKYGLRGISVWRLGQEDPAVWTGPLRGPGRAAQATGRQ